MTATPPPTPPTRSGLRTAVRWGARVVGGLLALVLVAFGIAYVRSERQLATRFPLPTHAPLVVADAADPALIERGRHIANVRGCTDCHAANLGGRVLVDDPMLGRIVPPNLTAGQGGRGAALTPSDWERAVRHGLRRDGTSLFVMPAQDYAVLTDEDMAALVAYARSVAPVNHELPDSRLGPLGRVLTAAGKLPVTPAAFVDQGAAHQPAITAEPTPAYGAYLAASCTGCHTERFAGGPMPGAPPGAPPAANITPDSVSGIGRWSEAEFMHALRTGQRPDGTAIDSTRMPIPMTRQMSDVELRAIYRYLRTVPPRTVAPRAVAAR